MYSVLEIYRGLLNAHRKSGTLVSHLSLREKCEKVSGCDKTERQIKCTFSGFAVGLW